MRMKYLIPLLVVPLLLLSLSLHALSAAELQVSDILADSDRARGNSSGLKWHIEMTSKENGRLQKRSMIVEVAGDNCLARMTAPAKVRDQLMLMRDRNMWFVKPGLRKPVPISPRQKLMGGAANADIASTNYVKDYQAVQMDEVEWNGMPCYLFDLRAVNKKVAYDRIRYWVARDTHLGVKAEFYSASGKMLKSATFRYDNRVQLEDGHAIPFVSAMIIHDKVIAENVTTMEYHDVEVKDIPARTFNLNLLVH